MTIKCARYGCNYTMGSPQHQRCTKCPHNRPINPPPLPKPNEKETSK